MSDDESVAHTTRRSLRQRWALASILIALPVGALASCGDDTNDRSATTATAATPTTATASSLTYLPDANPAGRSSQDWYGVWLDFLASGDDATSPIIHPDDCTVWKQPVSGALVLPHVAAGTTAEATCTVPAGTNIVAPGGAIWNWDTTADLTKAFVAEFPEWRTQVASPTVTVDGTVLKLDPDYYVEVTEPRPYKVPALTDEPLGPSGDYMTVGIGWIAVLKPLSKGTHTVVLSDQLAKFNDDATVVTDAAGKTVFETAVHTVHIEVTG